MSTADNENVGIALGLVMGAGAATALGAVVVFFPSLVKYANRKTLAGALGLSAGVMTYVSFVEIFQKSVGSFEDAGFDEDRAYIYATLCFFAGVVFMVALNATVTHILRGEHHHHHHHHSPDELRQQQTTSTKQTSQASASAQPQQPNTTNPSENEDSVHGVTPCPCCSETPAEDLNQIQHMAEEMEHKVEHEEGGHSMTCHRHADDAVLSEDQVRVGDDVNNDVEQSDQDSDDEAENNKKDEDHEDAKLMRMSIATALAIGLHNFPEGLATFVAALSDPKVGAVLAIAIAVHNVPEGLCVAMPIYYATGNRWKAFGWACLSGVSEPIAALLGWAVLAKSFSDTLYAVLFGIVAGMMVIISARELLPTAHRYDPDDSVVTYSFIAGMIIIALSLVLFLI